jgi:hypothetical protein
MCKPKHRVFLLLYLFCISAYSAIILAATKSVSSSLQTTITLKEVWDLRTLDPQKASQIWYLLVGCSVANSNSELWA